MNKIKILLVAVLGILLMNPAAALTAFRVDYSNLVTESPNLFLEIAPVELQLELADTADDFSKLDIQTAGRLDRQISSTLDQRKTLLETQAIPEINERAVVGTLDNYRDFRENQIRTEIQNVALQNDELGVLHRELVEYEFQLRLELANYVEVEKTTWEREYVNLAADMEDFVLYNKTLATRSAESEEPVVTSTKIIDLVTENKEDYSKTVDAIEESQESVVRTLIIANEEEDNSLIADKNSQLISAIESDQTDLNLKLATLEEEKEVIAALSTEITLMEKALSTDDETLLKDNPYADLPTTDLVILREESSAELERTLSTYETTQDDVQETLLTSITNLRTLELK